MSKTPEAYRQNMADRQAKSKTPEAYRQNMVDRQAKYEFAVTCHRYEETEIINRRLK